MAASRLLYIAVADDHGHGRRSTFRRVLQSTLQLIGCKPRHAFKARESGSTTYSHSDDLAVIWLLISMEYNLAGNVLRQYNTWQNSLMNRVSPEPGRHCRQRLRQVQHEMGSLPHPCVAA